LLIPFLISRIFFSVLSGLLVVRTFIIYHDHQHHSILMHSRLANLIMSGFGIFVLSPPSIWKRSHDHHHTHNSKLFSASIGSYPIMTTHKFMESTPEERRAYLIQRHPLTILFGYISMFVVGMSLRSFLSSPVRHFDS